MDNLARKLDDDEKPISAEQRAQKLWGMTPDDSEQDAEPSEDYTESGSALERANASWGSANILQGGNTNPGSGKKIYDGDQLADKETSAGIKDKPSAAPLAGEGAMASAADTLGKGYTGIGAAGSAVKMFFSKRSTKVGGGIAAGGIALFVFSTFFASSLYLVHLNEMAIGKANQFARLRTTSYEKRRGKSIVKKISDKRANKVFLQSFESKAASVGISVEKDTAGNITKLAMKETGQEIASFEKGLTKKGFGQFIETGAGREFVSGIDSIAPSVASEWRGIAAKRNFLQRLKLSMVNIFDRAPPDPDAGPKEKIAFAQANANETNEKGLINEAAAKDQLAKNNGVDPATNPDNAGNAGVDSTTQQTADDFADRVKTDPIAAAESLDAGENLVKDLAGDAAKAADNFDTVAFSTILATIKSKALSTGFKLFSNLINLLAIPQYGCKLVGTVNFLSNTQSVLMSLELAKFVTRILVSGSEQRAGIVKSESAKLAALYMAGATASGGMRWMSGDTDAQVSASSLSKYNTGGSPRGLLGSFKKFANSIPGVNNKNTCKFVNNGIIATAGIAVGLVAFVFGGSESGASVSNALFSTALQVGIDMTIAFATPLLVRMITQQVMTAVFDNISVGDAFASGAAALAASNGSANGARIITRPRAAMLQREADAYRKVELAHTSIFDRYFNLQRGDSLSHQLAFASPTSSFKDTVLNTTTLASRMTNVFSNPIAQVASAFSSKNNRAYAVLGSNQCDDPYLQREDIVTDPFCNPLVADIPNLDLDRTEEALRLAGEIDADGNPIPGKPFEAYIKNCLSGRSALLYNENISRDGNDGSGEDTTCIDNGAPLAGDFPETIYAMRDTGKPSFWDKLTGNTKAYAVADDETRTPGANERYTLWYGYLTDSANLEEDITGVYSDEINPTGNLSISTTLTPTGSATVGSFKNPSIAYDRANITLPDCDFSGAQPVGAVRGEQPGAKELQRLVNDRYSQGGTGFIFNCRAMTGNPSQPSVHGTGRAVDSFFNALSPSELQKGNDALGWLVANAELFGIQYVKFWRVQWTPTKGFTCVTSAADQGVHSSHIHFEVNWDGALKRTPYFTGTPYSNTGISVSQEICPRL